MIEVSERRTVCFVPRIFSRADPIRRPYRFSPILNDFVYSFTIQMQYSLFLSDILSGENSLTVNRTFSYHNLLHGPKIAEYSLFVKPRPVLHKNKGPSHHQGDEETAPRRTRLHWRA